MHLPSACNLMSTAFVNDEKGGFLGVVTAINNEDGDQFCTE